MADFKVPTKSTKEKYDRFIMYYLESFNATQSAIKAGYSRKTARQQGSRLLTVVYIQEKIRQEMKNLRKRMKEEGLRSFAMLLNIALETEEKIQKHNEASEQIEELTEAINQLNYERMELGQMIKREERLVRALDGRKASSKDEKRVAKNRLDDLKDKDYQLYTRNVKLCDLRDRKYLDHLDHKEWERLQNLKRSVFQDILDRGGFKPLEKIEHSGSVQSPGVNPNLNNLSKEELEALVNLGRDTDAGSS